MSYLLSPICNDQQCNANGAPLAGGKVYTYLAGSSTPAATYTDNTSGTQQANPILLNAMGLPASPIWMSSGTALKFIIKDASDVAIRTVDNVSGINDISALSQTEWVPSGLTPTYISATSFSFPGDQRAIFQVGRRVLTVNTGSTIYGTITSSTFSSSTTIVISPDSGSLDSGLSAVSYSLLNASNPSVPTALTLTGIKGGQIGGLHNRAINGGMLVAQRAAVAATNSYQYGQVDRHMVSIQGGTGITGNISQVAFNGSSTGKGCGISAGSWTNGNFSFQHRIESLNTQDMWGKPVTVSCKVYQNTGGTRNFKIIFAKPTTTADTFSSQTTLYTSPAMPASTGITTTISATYTMADTSLGVAVYVVDSDTPNTVTGKDYVVADLMVEVSPVASNFEQRPYGFELALCQRYYEKSYDIATAPGTATQTGAIAPGGLLAGALYTNIRFKVEKRVAPTSISTWDKNSNASSCGTYTVAGAFTTRACTTSLVGTSSFLAQSAATTDTYMETHFAASAEL